MDERMMYKADYIASLVAGGLAVLCLVFFNPTAARGWLVKANLAAVDFARNREAAQNKGAMNGAT